MRFGAHLSAGTGGLASTPRRARAIGADCVQVFVGNPRGWRTSRPTDDTVEAFRKACADTGVEPFIHAMYLVNYGTTDEALRGRSIAALRHTLQVADDLGVTGVVTHLGSHKGAGFAAGLGRLCDALAAGLADSRQTRLLVENSAGSGDNVGATIGELAAIADHLGRPERLGFCLDTAHLLAAGYDIRTRSGLDTLFDEFDTRIGLERLKLLHLNDSKTGLGSRVDRHENIGDGHIGSTGFAEILRHPAIAEDTPGVLEVPGLSGEGPDAANLTRLRALA